MAALARTVARSVCAGALALTIAACQSSGPDADAPTRSLTEPSLTVPTPAPAAAAASGWTGVVRSGARWPVVFPQAHIASWEYPDEPDAEVPGIDLTKVDAFMFRELSWNFVLREAPDRHLVEPDGPEGRSLSATEPRKRVAEYGVVVDGDGDRVADCEIGISDKAAPQRGHRMWVKSLRTAAVREVADPLGSLGAGFFYPEGAVARVVGIYFHRNKPLPCAPFTPSAAFYAWAVLIDDGRAVAWDFAPDAAWLHAPLYRL